MSQNANGQTTRSTKKKETNFLKNVNRSTVSLLRSFSFQNGDFLKSCNIYAQRTLHSTVLKISRSCLKPSLLLGCFLCRLLCSVYILCSFIHLHLKRGVDQLSITLKINRKRYTYDPITFIDRF